MFIHIQARRFQQLHYGLLESIVSALIIALDDDDEIAVGFQNAKDFLHVLNQIGPVILGFHGRNEIETVIRKEQPRDRSAPDLHPSRLNQLRVCAA
jgi:hypothetical protein